METQAMFLLLFFLPGASSLKDVINSDSCRTSDSVYQHDPEYLN